MLDKCHVQSHLLNIFPLKTLGLLNFCLTFINLDSKDAKYFLSKNNQKIHFLDELKFLKLMLNKISTLNAVLCGYCVCFKKVTMHFHRERHLTYSIEKPSYF